MMELCREDHYLQKDIMFYVLVPVYKAEAFIRGCIESVLSQTYQQFTLILVDDGSPDKAGLICDEYSMKYPNIMVVHQSNKGALAARQAALKCAKENYLKSNGHEYAYVVYLDSDDTLKPFALERISSAIMSSKCDIVVYDYDIVSDGKIVRRQEKSGGATGLFTDKRQIYNILFNDQSYNSLCRKAISFELLSDIDLSKYYGINHGEDLLESLSYLRACKSVYFLRDHLYNYVVNLGSVTNSINAQNIELGFEVRQQVNAFLKEENVFEDNDWVEYRTFCIQLLCVSINRILAFEVAVGEKRRLLNQIRYSEYYKGFIQRQKYNKARLSRRDALYFSLFERRLDGCLICGYKLKWIKKLNPTTVKNR